MMWESSEGAIVRVSLHQLIAAAYPRRSIRELTGEAGVLPTPRPHGASNLRSVTTPDSRGNFNDFDQLFEQLAKAPVIELGNPLPGDQSLPRSKVGSCPAAHNRALLGGAPD